VGPDVSRPIDSDGDGAPDYRDTDSNNNGIPDGETLLIWKTATKPVLATDGSFTIKYNITLRNERKEPINSVQVVEDFTRTFPSPMQFTVTDVKSTGILTKSAGFDGKTSTNLLASGVTMPGLTTDSVVVTVRLLPNGFSGDANNTAVGSAVTKWFNVTRNSIDITRSGGRVHGAGLPTVSAIPLVNTFISDVLTPNNDRFNDTWIILRPSNVKVGVTIFNRWGQLVYKTADYRNDWDGRSTNGFSGNMLPAGTYFYVVELSGGIYSAKEVRKGYLTLIRN
jgi:gliding motility-associated-like protein